MKYNIKAIPTTYAGVNFRSRLEARWAAFFDLCGWKWDYEPSDLEGWAPDFRLRTPVGPVLCEVKPYDIRSHIERASSGKHEPWPFDGYAKAVRHMRAHLVCLLGDEPLAVADQWLPIGVIDRLPPDSAVTFDQLHDALTPPLDAESAWREANNSTQWHPVSEQKTISQMLAVAKTRAEKSATNLSWADPASMPRRTRTAA